MTDYVDLLLLKFLNIFSFFSKLMKNNITFIISNTFQFKANSIMNEGLNQLFYILLK